MAYKKYALITMLIILTSAGISTAQATAPVSSKEALDQNKDQSAKKNITLNFSNIKVRELIQIIAGFTGLNFIIDDAVTGSMSIHIKDTPWPDALAIILQSKGLAQQRVKNNIIIGPLEKIMQDEENELKRKKQQFKLEVEHKIIELERKTNLENAQPLHSAVIKLYYAKADAVEKILKSSAMVSPRGKVSLDPRSNALVFKETNTHLQRIKHLIKTLDYPEKQVAINARIVNIDRPFEKSLGIRWGVTSIKGHLSGTLSGGNATHGTADPSTIPINDRLNFNNPATVSNGNAASLGIALARLGDFNVDLELSALEGEGKLVTISKPRLVTMNLSPAMIETGEEIPYAESTSSGATSISFKNASLSLKVLPRIADKNKVLLEITVTNNSPGVAVPIGTGGTAIPINAEQETSTILVDSGQTIVLGGVYKHEKNQTVVRVPFLGKIPILGNLFRQTVIKNNRSELLIFITPKIIRQTKDLNQS